MQELLLKDSKKHQEGKSSAPRNSIRHRGMQKILLKDSKKHQGMQTNQRRELV